MSTFHGEDGLFGPPKVQKAYNTIIFLFLMENCTLKIFGSVDVKIIPGFCSLDPLLAWSLTINIYTASILCPISMSALVYNRPCLERKIASFFAVVQKY
jgi:hypothetical protein